MSKQIKEDKMQREKKVKRVKTHHVRSSAVAVSSIYADFFQLEEEESEKQTGEECFSQFQDICKQLRKIFQAVFLAKKRKKADACQGYITDVCVLIMKLKKLNRLDKHRCKKSRDAVSEGKQNVDSLNLQYQNLLYEVTHLQKEVTKCLEFRSQDEEIDLIPVEQFYAEAPARIARPEVTKNDSHELTMARLEWELEQRKRLAAKLEDSEIKKEECKSSIRKLKECLQNIQPMLQSILEATEPLQSKLGMPLQATRSKHRIAKFLPKPLYILYIETSAYKEVCDKNMSVTIEGNIDNAKLFNMKVENIVDDSGESDQEENFNSNRHRHSVSIRPEDSQKDILDKHPLSICLNFKCKGSILSLEFFYLFHLNIVTVQVKNVILQTCSDLVRELLNPSTLLKCLFPSDEGKLSPNPTNKFLLQKIKYEDTPFSNDTSGWPYLWAQEISGLHFVSTENPETFEQKDASRTFAAFIESVMGAVRERITVRISLSEQIMLLESGSKVPSDISHFYPPNVVSQLKGFSSTQWDTIQKHPKYDELVELDFLRKDSAIFKATVERGSAVLTALIIIPLEYPNRSPIFLLFLSWKRASTSSTSYALRELEEEMNIHCVELLFKDRSSDLLMCQVYHLLSCFDIFLETEHAEESFVGPCEFVKEKVVTRNFRGRSHSRPYRYLSVKGIFTH